MTRLALSILLAAALLLPPSAQARRPAPHHPRAAGTAQPSSAPQPPLGPAPHHPRAAGTPQPSPTPPPLGQPASPNPAALASSVAQAYWGAVPCGGQVAVLANMPLAPGLGPATDGWVTFASSLGPNDLEAPASTYTQCTIWLAHWHWPTQAAMRSDWNMFCLTVIHEMGHLLGHPHSSTPGSVMAPVFTDESDVPPICRAARSRLLSGR